MWQTIYPVGICLSALLLDRIFGEPKYHPLIGFGLVATRLDCKLNIDTKLSGVVGVLLLILPIGFAVYWTRGLIQSPWFLVIYDVFLLYISLGWQSMKEHAGAIQVSLSQNKTPEARQALAMIVSRETGNMNELQIVGSTIESVLENGHDSVFASLFWFALLGPIGAIGHRLINTLDAMWGYKNAQYLNFGWCAARFDDILGWIPARLTAICYASSGAFTNAIAAWSDQIGKHKSPNAGLVMASGAGALKIKVGGPATYDGLVEDKPWLGRGSPATNFDIQRAINLIERSICIWLACYLMIVLLSASHF